MELLIKYGISAAIVVIVNEVVVKKGATLGSLIASLPLVSLLGIIFIYFDLKPEDRVDRLATHSTAIFWFVIPSLPMFLLFPWLLRKGMNFWGSLGLGCILTIVLYVLTAAFLKRAFGMTL